VEVANATEFGLGASLWTSDLERAATLIPQLGAGAVFVNDIVTSDLTVGLERFKSRFEV
jgi:succinate-semialdehyde dehydrogenase / glutarate-semialdehyde dehydrogenase